MTTIYIAQPTVALDAYQVFGNYDGEDDRYTFAFRGFPNSPGGFLAAEEYAIRLAARHLAEIELA